MGNPAYDARRAVEKSEADRDKAFADASKTALEGVVDFFNGKAFLEITPGNIGNIVRFVRDKD